MAKRHGTNAKDTIEGTRGNDQIDGRGGNDLIYGSRGADVIDGGTGRDTIAYSRTSQAVTVDLVRGFAESARMGRQSLISIENAIGGNGNDKFYGSTHAEAFNGGIGDDTIHAGGGKDSVNGGVGNDVLTLIDNGDFYDSEEDDSPSDRFADGGAGNDHISVRDAHAYVSGGDGDDVIVSDGGNVVHGGAGNDVITAGILNFIGLYGDDGNDTIIGAGFDSSLLGGNGDDVLFAGYGPDDTSVDGGDGIDRYGYTASDDVGFQNIDTTNVSVLDINGDSEFYDEINGRGLSLISFEGVWLQGSKGTNVLIGGVGQDMLIGDDGNDTLNGAAANDVLKGGNGDDLLIGGSGIDRLQGNKGADVFAFEQNDTGVRFSARDHIVFFNQAEGDRIDLSAIDGDKTTALTFVGTAAFSHQAGELQTYVTENGTVVAADIDGDGKADIAIQIDNVVALLATDFVL